MKVLKRQSLVHDIIYVDTVQSADVIVASWSTKSGPPLLCSRPDKGIHRVDVEKLKKRGGKTLALISHDGKKLDMCLLVTEFLPTILSFNTLIATGTTGKLFIQRYHNTAPDTIPHTTQVRTLATTQHASI